ncbi:hypothetical protein ZIOFF_061900 [Zingiber officinale]|uniref:CCHC-type domain-containing protein n=1 Tax=Zingiber officinale TaxID=94328 RepID=A0A8J5F4T3_ZINOF|nr:hypothetical protein ZIOFF_061900 [Zingiber officinale]
MQRRRREPMEQALQTKLTIIDQKEESNTEGSQENGGGRGNFRGRSRGRGRGRGFARGRGRSKDNNQGKDQRYDKRNVGCYTCNKFGHYATECRSNNVQGNANYASKEDNAMAKAFDMIDMRLMSYFLGLEVKQGVDGIFMSQEQYANEVLKRFRMDDCNPVNTPVDCGTKLSKNDEGKTIDPIRFKSLVGSLRYLTCTRPDILYEVGLVSRFMEEPKETHWKAAKRILRYVRGTMNHGLFYSHSNNSQLVGYSDIDWGGDCDDQRIEALPALHFSLEIRHFLGCQRNNLLLLFPLVKQSTLLHPHVLVMLYG